MSQLSPSPTTAATGSATSPDADRLDRLRRLAERDEHRAAREAWAWFAELRPRAEHDRLPWLFAQGEGVEPPHGDCRGIVMGLHGAPWLQLTDVAVRLGRLLGGIGWAGKSFDTVTSTGHNRLTRGARLPALLLMPTYGFDRVGGELVGFRFHHRVETSPVAPHGRVCAIRYDAPEHGNPLVLPRTRDEIVELVPGVFLGRALLRTGHDHEVVGYFGLLAPRHVDA